MDELLIFGRHPVLDALETGRSIEKIALQLGVRGDFERTIRQTAKARNIPLQVVPKERFGKWTKGNHQGVVAWLSPIEYDSLEALLPFLFDSGATPLLMLLDGVTDVRNFGAIARSAELAGVDALVIPAKNSAQITAEAIKTSAGALTKLSVCREKSLLGAVEFLKASGLRVLASKIPSEKALYEVDLTGPVALIVRAEGEGVSDPILRAADEHFWIPQRGTTDSFNVSVAAGIMLYEVMRQRVRLR